MKQMPDITPCKPDKKSNSYILWKLLQAYMAYCKKEHRICLDIMEYVLNTITRETNGALKTPISSAPTSPASRHEVYEELYKNYDEIEFMRQQYRKSTAVRDEAYKLQHTNKEAFERFQTKRKLRMSIDECNTVGDAKKCKKVEKRRQTFSVFDIFSPPRNDSSYTTTHVPPLLSPLPCTPRYTQTPFRTPAPIPPQSPNIFSPERNRWSIEEQLQQVTGQYEASRQPSPPPQPRPESVVSDSTNTSCRRESTPPVVPCRKNVIKSQRIAAKQIKGVAFYARKNTASCVTGSVSYIRSKLKNEYTFVPPMIATTDNINTVWTDLSSHLIGTFKDKIKITNKKIVMNETATNNAALEKKLKNCIVKKLTSLHYDYE